MAEKLNYSGGKILLKFIAENFVVKLFTKALMFIFYYMDRIYSHLKLRVLIPDAKNCLAHYTINVIHGHNVTVGMNVGIGPNVLLGALSPITIGNDVRISMGVVIQTGGLDFSQPPPYQHDSKPIIIEDGVWLGTNAMILGGVTIGHHSVIGANTVITKDIPPHSIVVGQSFRILDKKTKSA